MIKSCDEFIVLASASRWLLNAVGGFLGGTSLLVYIKPSGFIDAIARVMVTTCAGIFIAPLAIERIWETPDEVQVLGASFVTGFISWNLFGAVALWMDRRKDKDVAELIKEVKNNE